MKKNRCRVLVSTFLIILVSLLPTIYVFYEAFSILGPWGKPDLLDKQWVRLTVGYILVTDRGNLSRGTVLDSVLLRDLKNTFKVKKSDGVSFPATGNLFLETDNGSRWKIDFSVPDRIVACNDDDDYYTYSIKLADTGFHEALRKKCLERERIWTPQANIENIKLCTGGLGKIQEKYTPLHVNTSY